MAPTDEHRNRQIHDSILHSRRILLATHERADGDALGSILAFSAAYSDSVEALLLAPDTVLRPYAFLHDVDRIRTSVASVRPEAFDTIVLFDCGDVRRTHLAEKLYFLGPHRPNVFLIDHHPVTLTHRDQTLVDIAVNDRSASSTAELVYRYLRDNHLPINAHMATALLAGIVTDTGGFTNQATTHRCMEVAGELMQRGANLRTVVQATVRSKTVGILQLWGRALSRLEFDDVDDLVSTALTLRDFDECSVGREASEGIANFLNGLGEGKVILVLREEPSGRVKGSYRTKHENIDVSKLAGRFGGGGHAKAAGFSATGTIEKQGNRWTVVPTVGT